MNYLWQVQTQHFVPTHVGSAEFLHYVNDNEVLKKPKT